MANLENRTWSVFGRVRSLRSNLMIDLVSGAARGLEKNSQLRYQEGSGWNTSLPVETENLGLCLTSLFLADPLGEEDQEIIGWMEEEYSSQPRFFYEEDGRGRIFLELVFRDIQDALKFKLKFGDYLVQKHEIA